jgi:hypothetical protein
MRVSPRKFGLAVLAAGLALSGAAARTAPAPRIEPQADRVLKQMCTFLAGLKTFSFSAVESIDDVREGGQVVEMTNRRKVIVSRPNRLFSAVEGDRGSRQFLYDGTTATLVDRKANVYAIEKARGTIEATLDDLFKRFGVTVPLADLLCPDAYKVMTEHAQSGTVVGTHAVGETPCRHLAFRGAKVDWQIWIEEGDRPLPHRVVLRFRQAEAAPRYAAFLGDWDLSPAITDATFTFARPADVRKIAFLPVPAGTPAPNPVKRRTAQR